MSLDLKGKSALVTGGGRGMGRSIALGLAAAGARVTVTARTEAEVAEVVREIEAAGGVAQPVICDVGQRESVAMLIEAAAPVDILVNNAGMAPSGPFASMDEEVWERTLQVNLTGPMRLMKAALPGMVQRKWGRIINIGSTVSKTALPYTAAYTASKHALLGLTRAVALEVAKHGVTVNAICPGYANTPMTTGNVERLASRTGKSADHWIASFASTSPQGRLVEPDEVAHLVLMLCAEGARGVTGQGIMVDGGAVLS